MATLVESADTESMNNVVSSTPSSLSQHFVDNKFYLLVVIGEVVTEDHLKCAIADIEKGIRSWDTNLIDCNLDQELKLFVSRHSARFSADVRGQRILHHKSNVLETVVLINPSDEAVCTETRLMISDTARHKLLVLSGQCLENTGEMILQSGSFSFFNFIDIFTDQELGELLSTIHPANKASLTLFCPEQGDWKNSNLDKHNLQDFINIKLHSPLILPEMEGLSEFTEYLSESVEIPSPFDMLEPPTSGGFLKLSKPCCYIFPGGRGDSALFAVNGFNMLINGGSDRKACFWKLVRHLDRVDSILLTHVGDDNLPGINSMLLRKVVELEEEQSQGSSATGDWVKNMISPDIGVMFLNIPENLGNPEPNFRVRKNAEEAAFTLQYISKLSLRTESLHRPVGNTIEPIILFQKMGVGKLEMYVLNPSKNSKEMQQFMKHWTGSEKDKASILLPNGKESELPVSYLTSISSLIVWHPSHPSEKIVRVLFPGNATQYNILEGLEKLKHLDFLKQPVVTQKELSSNMAPSLKQAKLKHKTDSKESLQSTSRPSPSRSLRKESKEEAPGKAKTDESTPEKTQKAEKKEKPLVKKEKAKVPEKDLKAKGEQAPQSDTPEKKKAEIKPKLTKEKIIKREPKKSVEKKADEKEGKKEEVKKDEKPTPQKEEKPKKEEKVKKEDVKKDIKKDFRRDSPMKERKEMKQEQKKDDLKRDTKKPLKDVKKTASALGEGKKLVPKPKPLKKDDASKKETGSPSKSKDKAKSKVSKKDTKAVDAKSGAAAAAAGVAAATCAAKALETERSQMSSPEDLTKDFEELRAEDLVEDDATVPHTKQGGDEEEEEEGVMIHREEVMFTKESPEAAESLDEGITTTEAEGESGETPDEQEHKDKINGSGSEKFEDEGTGLEEASDAGDDEEKGEMEDADELRRRERDAKDRAGRGNVETESEDEGADVEQYGTDLNRNEEQIGRKGLFGTTTPPRKTSELVSPAASIHDETLPVEAECEGASDDENRDEPPEEYTTSGHTLSTIEISSVPTPMDEMSTPRDIMSDETTNDESDSPSQDFVRFGGSASGDLERKRLSPLQDGPESNHSKSELTEGRDYHASASTISPPSSLEEDKLCEEFPRDEREFKSDKHGLDLTRLSSESTTSPLIRSPSVDHKGQFDSSPSRYTPPIELCTTLTGASKEVAESSNSPDDKTLEGTTSPQSSGHTPYYQSPVDEKAGAIPPESGAKDPRGPIIVEVTSDKEELLGRISPLHESKPDHPSTTEKVSPEKSPPPHADSPTKGGKSHFDLGHMPISSGPEEKKNNGGSDSSSAPHTKQEFDTNPFTGLKEESKMSISEGTTSDKSGTPVDEAVAEDTFSHLASASTASLATSSLPEPATDSRSLHAEVGSPHSTEVDDSLSVSVVQTPTTFQEAEGSPTKEDSPRPMSISPDISPKTAKTQEAKSPEQSTISVEFGQDSPDHSLALDFSKQSPEHVPSHGEGGLRATQNGPTEVDYSPSEGSDIKQAEHHHSTVEKPMLFKDTDSARAPSASPSDASQSTPSVTTPCQMREMDSKSPLTPKAASPSSYSCFPQKAETLSAEAETNPFKCGDSTIQSKSPVSPKIPSPSYLPLSSNLSDFQKCAGGSKGPDSSKKSPSSQSRTDVDLCLVTSCEYRHTKTELSPSFINPSPLEYFINEEAKEKESPMAKAGGGPPPPTGKLHAKQCEETPPTSFSESAPSQTDSDVPPGTEECPSITADANIDSEDDSETLPTDRTLTYRHADPHPVAARDSAPSPARPDVCMVDPEAAAAAENNRSKDLKVEGKETPKKKKLTKTKSSSPARRSGLSKVKDMKTASPKKSAGEGKDAKNATNTSASKGVKSATSGSGSGKATGGVSVPNCPPMYMDLVYIPNHCSAKNVDAEFFKRVRSSYYVVSGNDQAAQEPSKVVLDSLLEGKAQWGNNMQVTLIPTHDSEVMREWYQETHDQQQDLNIMVLASSSTVVMQDESFPACKIEL